MAAATAEPIRGEDAMDWSRIPTNPLDLLVFLIVGIVGAAMFIPKWLKENRTENGIIDRLSRELTEERQLRRDETNRADQFARERNELIIQFSDMKRDNALIVQRLEAVTRQNEELTAINVKLTEHVKQLSRTVENIQNDPRK